MALARLRKEDAEKEARRGKPIPKPVKIVSPRAPVGERSAPAPGNHFNYKTWEEDARRRTLGDPPDN